MAIFKIESYKSGIVISTLFNIVNKGLVFLNGVLVAYYLGVKDSTDIFFYIYNALLLLGVFVASLNSSVLIPESMRIRTMSGDKIAMEFLNYFIALYAIILVILLCIVLISPVFLFSLISNFHHELLSDNVVLLYLSLPLGLFIGIITLFIDILASYKFFTISMVVGIINGLTSILFVFLFHEAFEIRSVFFGLILSYTFNVCFLAFLMKRYLRWNFRWKRLKIEKRVWTNLGFAQLGNFTSILTAYMPLYILSGFATGIITSLTFAQQISGLPNALIIAQFSSVAGIKFNELSAERKYSDINKFFLQTAEFLSFLMVPTGFFIFFFSSEIVNFLLGKRVLATSGVSQVAFFLQYLGLLLPMMAINTLVGRLFMAVHKVKEGFWYQVTFNIILLTGMYVSVKAFGIIGYPVSMLVAHTCNVVICYFLTKRYFNFINYPTVLRKLFIIIVVNLAISVPVFYAVGQMGLSNILVKLIVGFSCYAILLLVINKIFKISFEMNVQVSNIYRKLI